MVSGFELVTDVADREVDQVYRAAFAEEQGGPAPEFLSRQLPTHRAREGFAIVGAVRDGVLLGFVYGYTGQRGQWWTEHVATHAPEQLVATWLGGHFEVVELAVVPEARGAGIAAALLTAILQDRPEPRALLGTWQHPSPARRLYERLGWVELLPDLDGTYSLYGRPLP